MIRLYMRNLASDNLAPLHADFDMADPTLIPARKPEDAVNAVYEKFDYYEFSTGYAWYWQRDYGTLHRFTPHERPEVEKPLDHVIVRLSDGRIYRATKPRLVSGFWYADFELTGRGHRRPGAWSQTAVTVVKLDA